MALFNLTADLQLRVNNLRQVQGQVGDALRSAARNFEVNVSPQSIAGMERLSIGAKAAATAMSGYTQSATAARTATTALAGNVAQAGTTMEQFGALTGLAARRFIAFSAGAGSFVAIVRGLKEGTKEALNFERELVRLSQVSNELPSVLRQIPEEVTRVAKATGVSSTELLKGSNIFVQAGLKAKEAAALIQTLGDAALAPNFDNMQSVAEGMIAVMRQFQTDADGTKNAIGAMNAVAGEFAVEGRDLIEVVRRTGGAFKTAGGDVNELLALFTAVRGTTRESASEISTGLRTIFSRIQRGETVQALKELNVELRYTSQEADALGRTDLNGQFVGAYEAVKRLSEGLSGLRTTDTRYSQIVEELGGFRQVSRVIPLIQQFGEAQKALNVAQSGGNSLTASTEKAQASLLVQISKVKEEYLELFRTIVGSTGFQSLAKGALSLASGLGTVLDTLKPLLPLLTTLAALKIASGIGGFLGNLTGSFTGTNLKTVVPTIKKASGGVVPGVGDTDSVPAYLTPGEFVIKKSSALAIGYDRLAEMNSGGAVRMAGGGPARAPLTTYSRDNLLAVQAALNEANVPVKLSSYFGGLAAGPASGFVSRINDDLRPAGLAHVFAGGAQRAVQAYGRAIHAEAATKGSELSPFLPSIKKVLKAHEFVTSPGETMVPDSLGTILPEVLGYDNSKALDVLSGQVKFDFAKDRTQRIKQTAKPRGELGVLFDMLQERPDAKLRLSKSALSILQSSFGNYSPESLVFENKQLFSAPARVRGLAAGGPVPGERSPGWWKNALGEGVKEVGSLLGSPNVDDQAEVRERAKVAIAKPAVVDQRLGRGNGGGIVAKSRYASGGPVELTLDEYLRRNAESADAFLQDRGLPGVSNLTPAIYATDHGSAGLNLRVLNRSGSLGDFAARQNLRQPINDNLQQRLLLEQALLADAALGEVPSTRPRGDEVRAKAAGRPLSQLLPFAASINRSISQDLDSYGGNYPRGPGYRLYGARARAIEHVVGSRAGLQQHDSVLKRYPPSNRSIGEIGVYLDYLSEAGALTPALSAAGRDRVFGALTTLRREESATHLSYSGKKLSAERVKVRLASGGLARLPRSQRTTREELLHSIEARYADNPSPYKPLFDTQARLALTPEALSRIPKGSSFIGAGAVGLAFRTPDGEVIRLQSNQAAGVAQDYIRQTENRDVSPDVLSSVRPRVPEVLQPLAKSRVGRGKDRVLLEKLPFASAADALPYPDLTSQLGQLEKSLGNKGYQLQDVRLGRGQIKTNNLGIVGGKLVVVDPGAVQKDRSGLLGATTRELSPEDRQKLIEQPTTKSTLRKFASGGIVTKENILSIVKELKETTGIDFSKVVRNIKLVDEIEEGGKRTGQFGRYTFGDEKDARGTITLNRSTIKDVDKLRHVLSHELGHGVDALLARQQTGRVDAELADLPGSEGYKYATRESSLQKLYDKKDGRRFSKKYQDYRYGLDESFANVFSAYTNNDDTTRSKFSRRGFGRRVVEEAAKATNPQYKEKDLGLFGNLARKDNFLGKVSRFFGFATGGDVPGSGNTDTVPALLTPGEFVLNKDAVARIGSAQLHQMNVRGYNAGGIVQRFAGGTEGPVKSVEDSAQKIAGAVGKLAATIDKTTSSVLDRLRRGAKKAATPEELAAGQSGFAFAETGQAVAAPLASQLAAKAAPAIAAVVADAKAKVLAGLGLAPPLIKFPERSGLSEGEKAAKQRQQLDNTTEGRTYDAEQKQLDEEASRKKKGNRRPTNINAIAQLGSLTKEEQAQFQKNRPFFENTETPTGLTRQVTGKINYFTRSNPALSAHADDVSQAALVKAGIGFNPELAGNKNKQQAFADFFQDKLFEQKTALLRKQSLSKEKVRLDAPAKDSDLGLTGKGTVGDRLAVSSTDVVRDVQERAGELKGEAAKQAKRDQQIAQARAAIEQVKASGKKVTEKRLTDAYASQVGAGAGKSLEATQANIRAASGGGGKRRPPKTATGGAPGEEDYERLGKEHDSAKFSAEARGKPFDSTRFFRERAAQFGVQQGEGRTNDEVKALAQRVGVTLGKTAPLDKDTIAHQSAILAAAPTGGRDKEKRAIAALDVKEKGRKFVGPPERVSFGDRASTTDVSDRAASLREQYRQARATQDPLLASPAKRQETLANRRAAQEAARQADFKELSTPEGRYQRQVLQQTGQRDFLRGSEVAYRDQKTQALRQDIEKRYQRSTPLDQRGVESGDPLQQRARLRGLGVGLAEEYRLGAGSVPEVVRQARARRAEGAPEELRRFGEGQNALQEAREGRTRRQVGAVTRVVNPRANITKQFDDEPYAKDFVGPRITSEAKYQRSASLEPNQSGQLYLSPAVVSLGLVGGGAPATLGNVSVKDVQAARQARGPAPDSLRDKLGVATAKKRAELEELQERQKTKPSDKRARAIDQKQREIANVEKRFIDKELTQTQDYSRTNYAGRDKEGGLARPVDKQGREITRTEESAPVSPRERNRRAQRQIGGGADPLLVKQKVLADIRSGKGGTDVLETARTAAPTLSPAQNAQLAKAYAKTGGTLLPGQDRATGLAAEEANQRANQATRQSGPSTPYAGYNDPLRGGYLPPIGPTPAAPGRKARPTTPLAQTGATETTGPKLIQQRANVEVQQKYKQLGGVISEQTKSEVEGKATAKQTARLRREVYSAELRALRETLPDSSDSERKRLAREATEKVVKGDATLAVDKSGKVLATTGSAQRATAAGVSAPGAGGAGYAFSNAVSSVGDAIGKVGSGIANTVRRANESSFGRSLSGLGGLTYPALIALPYLSEGVGGLAGTSQEAVAGNRTGAYRAAQAGSGAIQGAVLGGTIGFALGQGIGAVVGAAGGALVGLVTSLRQADKDIRNVKIGNAIVNFTDKLATIANVGLDASPEVRVAAGEQLTELKTLSSTKNQKDATGFFGFGRFKPDAFVGLQNKSIREDLGGQLPTLQQSLTTQAQQLVTRNPALETKEVFSALKAGNGNINNEFIQIIARIRGLPIAAVEQELRKTIEGFKRTQRIEKSTLEGRKAAEQNVNAFGRLVLSLQAASDSLYGLQLQAKVLTDLFEGVVSPNRVSAQADNLTQLGRGDRGASIPLGIIRAVGGEDGARLADVGEATDRLSNVLPAILAQVSTRNFQGPSSGEDFVSAVGTQLRVQFKGDKEAERGIPVILRGLNQLGKDGVKGIQDEVQVDVTRLTERLVEPFAGPLKDSGARAARLIQDNANAYIDGLVRFRQQLSVIGEGLDRLAQNVLSTQRGEAEVLAAQTGRRSEAVNFLSLEQLQQPGQSQLERLTQKTGEPATSPRTIAEELRRVRSALPGAQVAQDQQFRATGGKGDEFQKAAREVVRLQSLASNFNQALKLLADASTRNAAIQEKLAKIGEDRQSRLSFGERFFSSDPEGRAQTSRGLILANVANNKGNIDGFVPQDQRLILETLRSLGGAKLTGFQGQPIASDLVEKLLKNSAGGVFGLDKQGKGEEASLQAQFLANLKKAEQAQSALVEQQKTLSSDFFTNLGQSQSDFLTRLEALFTKDKLVEAKVKLGQSGADVRGKAQLGEQRDILKVLGVERDDQLGNAKAALPDIQKLASARAKVAQAGTRYTQSDIASENIFGELFSGAGADDLKGHKLTAPAQARLTDLLIARDYSSDDAAKITKDFASRIDKNSRANHNPIGGKVSTATSLLSESLKQSEITKIAEQENEIAKTKKSLEQKGINTSGVERVLGKEGYTTGTTKITGAVGAFDGTTNKLDGLDKKIQETTASFQALREQARALQFQLGEVPTDLTTANSALSDYGIKFPGFASGFAQGGNVFQPRGTDTVPAMLTPGEFVVNARSAQANREVLDKINSAKGTAYLAGGGFLDEDPLDLPKLKFFDKAIARLEEERTTDGNPKQEDINYLQKERDRIVTRRLVPLGIEERESEIGPPLPVESPLTANRELPLFTRPSTGQHFGVTTSGGIATSERSLPAKSFAGDGFGVRGRTAGRELENKQFTGQTFGVLVGGRRVPVGRQPDEDLLPPLVPQGRFVPEIEPLGIIGKAIPREPGPAPIQGLTDGFDGGIGQLFAQTAEKDRESRAEHDPALDKELRRQAVLNPYGSSALLQTRQRLTEEGATDKRAARVLHRQATRGRLQGLGRSAGLARSGPSPFAAFGYARPSNQSGVFEAASNRRRALNQRAEDLDFLLRQEKAARARPFGFAAGGSVPGPSDTVPAMLTPGEFVVNAASARAHLPLLSAINAQGFARGGVVAPSPSASGGVRPEVLQALARSMNGFVATAPGFNASVTALVGAFDTFGESSRMLAEALSAFPHTLNVQGQQRVEVVINGAEVLSRLQPAIQEAVQDAMKDQLNSIFQSAFPEAGVNIGN